MHSFEKDPKNLEVVGRKNRKYIFILVFFIHLISAMLDIIENERQKTQNDCLIH